MLQQDKTHFYSYLQEHCRLHFNSGNTLDTALNYALLNKQAKRLRPLLTLTAARAFGCTQPPMSVALAVEFVHTFSLIHDDLPCMDDDSERRGQKTLHVQFNEAIALLAGDALLCEAFQLVVAELPAEQARECVRLLAAAVGSKGMISGQTLELTQAEPTQQKTMESLYRLKTGKLMGAACALGAVAADQSQSVVEKMFALGEHVGLLFQVKDDIADNDVSATINPQQYLTAGMQAVNTSLSHLELQQTDFAKLCAEIVSPV